MGKRWGWIGLCLGLLSIGCQATTPTPETAVVTAVPSAYQVLIPANDFVVGTPRLPLVLFDGPDPVGDATAMQVRLFGLQEDGSSELVWTGEATPYRDYEVPYWVVYPEIPLPGTWGLEIQTTLADGSQDVQRRSLEVGAEGGAPEVGSAAPAVRQRTITDQPDLTLLTSATEPNPALYTMTIADALASGRPSVITFATPAFCQTQLCAPTLESVEAVYAAKGQAANFIHVEIYQDFQTLEVAQAVRDWGLISEPWTFVVDSQGVVQARLAGPVSPTELTEQLEAVLPVEG